PCFCRWSGTTHKLAMRCPQITIRIRLRIMTFLPFSIFSPPSKSLTLSQECPIFLLLGLLGAGAPLRGSAEILVKVDLFAALVRTSGFIFGPKRQLCTELG